MLRVGFPIAECIDNCYLTDIGLREMNGKTFIYLKFIKDNAILEDYIENPRKTILKEFYDTERLRITKLIESIALVFVDRERLVTIRTESTNLKDYIETLKHEIKINNGFEIPISLKTVKGSNGKAKLPKYIDYGGIFFPFIKRTEDGSKILKYSKLELNLNHGIKQQNRRR